MRVPLLLWPLLHRAPLAPRVPRCRPRPWCVALRDAGALAIHLLAHSRASRRLGARSCRCRPRPRPRLAAPPLVGLRRCRRRRILPLCAGQRGCAALLGVCVQGHRAGCLVMCRWRPLGARVQRRWADRILVRSLTPRWSRGATPRRLPFGRHAGSLRRLRRLRILMSRVCSTPLLLRMGPLPRAQCLSPAPRRRLPCGAPVRGRAGVAALPRSLLLRLRLRRLRSLMALRSLSSARPMAGRSRPLLPLAEPPRQCGMARTSESQRPARQMVALLLASGSGQLATRPVRLRRLASTGALGTTPNAVALPLWGLPLPPWSAPALHLRRRPPRPHRSSVPLSLAGPSLSQTRTSALVTAALARSRASSSRRALGCRPSLYVLMMVTCGG